MTRRAWIMPLFAALALFAGAADAASPPKTYAPGSVSRDEGLRIWAKFYEIASHPRCVNCHVGPDNRPMWSGPSYGETRPHGMNINAGRSRVGAEAVPCSACHAALSKPDPNANRRPHTPPRVAQAWALAPAGAAWFGKSSDEICLQLRDPKRNGGMSVGDLAAHLDHDKVLRWAWNPGGGRQPAPYSLEASVDFLLQWGAAGTPCPGD